VNKTKEQNLDCDEYGLPQVFCHIQVGFTASMILLKGFVFMM
jgi:hypothetical protein